MMRFLFICHSHHQSTCSALFFQELLKSRYALEICYVQPGIPSAAEKLYLSLSGKSFDAVVLWQIDYLASYFTKRGIPTVICPMVDASAGLKNIHWRSMRGSLLVCFSYSVYSRACHNGLKALYVKYWPTSNNLPHLEGKSKQKHENISKLSDKTHGDSTCIRAFFWERRPDSPINTSTIIELLRGTPVTHLHIHQAADLGLDSTAVPNTSHLKVTTSSWFQDKNEYLFHISEAHVYIAPRLHEGIGMSFLEAMGMNCCVIAPNNPTYNEYIIHNSNGLLIDYDNFSPLRIEGRDIAALALAAGDASITGKQNWLSTYLPLLTNAIEEYLALFMARGSKDTVNPRGDNRFAGLYELTRLSFAHYDWDLYYDYLCRTEKHSLVHDKVDESYRVKTIEKLLRERSYGEAISLIDKLIDSSPPHFTVYKLLKSYLTKCGLPSEIE